MDIIPSEVEKYCKKIGCEIHIGIGIESEELAFRFVKGRYEQYGSTAVYLDGKEINEILELNSILGQNGVIKNILNSDSRRKDEEIHDRIYGTLAKYVIQMLNASSARILFDDIKPLAKHADNYFRNDVEPKRL